MDEKNKAMNDDVKLKQFETISKQLVTISDLLRWTTSRFCEADLFYGHGTDSAWDEAVQLVLQLLYLPLDIDDRVLDARLTIDERTKIVECVYRRVIERIPLPYLTNTAWFAGMKFYVDERVIVPRSPLGEFIRKGFEPWVDSSKVHSVLDLCTGSGCIGIACSYVFPKAKIVISDISQDALDVAQRNVTNHDQAEQVTLVKSDLFNQLSGQYFDLIVSNPPYVDAQEYEKMPSEFRKEPVLALTAGEDGLDIVKRILAEAPHHLNDGGILIVEVGESQYALQKAFPDIPFTWLNFESGGDGVFLLTAEELLHYHENFLKAVPNINIQA